MPKRAPTWLTCSQRFTHSIVADAARLCIALALLCGVSGAGSGNASPSPTVQDLVTLYDRAMTDPNAPAVQRFEVVGTIAGAALTGTFHEWQDGDDERTDQSLGLRQESTIRLGERYFFVSSTGNVREYRGSLLRRSRTQTLIDSGDLAGTPDCCRLGGTQVVDGVNAEELVVTAPGGDTESLFVDPQTGLPLRLAYEEDDGTTTVDLSDWRSYGGRRFPFKSVSSDGNHDFDITQITTSITMNEPIDPAIFAVPANRSIETAGVQHLDLVEHDAHLFAPVSISGHAYTFLVDTGAQSILLDESVARQLHLHEEGALEASGAARTGGLHLAKLDDLEVAGATMHDLVVTTLDLGASTEGAFHIDGILGYPFFASAAVRIDFAHETMDFGPPGSLTPSGDRLNADFDRGLVELPAMAN
ncbi:MAG TPA: retropepsin-like aspartic protease, partial [Candidatus Acidoferrales bacterium]|nr:retropepsin-like aspartic protease [Candidatus Acidoferrales bacterium]